MEKHLVISLQLIQGRVPFENSSDYRSFLKELKTVDVSKPPEQNTYPMITKGKFKIQK